MATKNDPAFFILREVANGLSIGVKFDYLEATLSIKHSGRSISQSIA
jgi:hypothetical protein